MWRVSMFRGKPYAQCAHCHKFVRQTGWFARWHLCLHRRVY